MHTDRRASPDALVCLHFFVERIAKPEASGQSSVEKDCGR